MCSLNVNRLESFSDEILLDIFEYLDAYNLYQAFYGLNHRINNLLKTANLYILYDSTKKDETVWNTLVSFVNPSQIRILSSYNNININEQFISSVKKNLRSIHINTLNWGSVNEILRHLPDDNHIKCFYICGTTNYSDRSTHSIFDFVLAKHGYRFTSLVNLSLSCPLFIDNFPIISIIFPQLRHLSITNCNWSENFCQFLQSNTPNLRSLKYFGYIYDRSVLSKFVIKHVHELHISYSMNFIELKHMFLLFPCLRRFHIDWNNTRQSECIDGTQWQELIEKYLPYLKQFTIEFAGEIDEDIAETFQTREFWSKKKVNMKMIMNKAASRYRMVKAIYFGKQWRFEYHDKF